MKIKYTTLILMTLVLMLLAACKNNSSQVEIGTCAHSELSDTVEQAVFRKFTKLDIMVMVTADFFESAPVGVNGHMLSVCSKNGINILQHMGSLEEVHYFLDENNYSTMFWAKSDVSSTLNTQIKIMSYITVPSSGYEISQYNIEAKNGEWAIEGLGRHIESGGYLPED